MKYLPDGKCEICGHPAAYDRYFFSSDCLIRSLSHPPTGGYFTWCRLRRHISYWPQANISHFPKENISLETALSKYKLPKAAILALDYRDNRDLDQTLIEATQLGLSPTELGLALKTVDPTLDIPKIIAQ